MTTTTTTVAVQAPAAAAPKVAQAKPALPAASKEAKQRAAAILEVLAGVRTPGAAAQALGVSLPRYYLLEERALHGLVQACEARPRGRAANAEGQRQRLERDCQHWQRECARQQALVRAAQRTIGLTAVVTPVKDAKGAKDTARKRRPRRPRARALRAVARLTGTDAADNGAISTAPATPG